MRISHIQNKEDENLLKDVSYTTWRFYNSRENNHRESVNKLLNSRPRYRRESNS